MVGRLRALDLANELLGADDHVFDATSVMRLLYYSLSRDPGRFGPQLLRALAGTDTVAARAGEIWAACYVRDLLLPPVPSALPSLSAEARRGAAEWLASNPAEAADQLIELFNDEDSGVRKAAASVVRQIDDADRYTREVLVSAFVSSKAFEDHFDDLFSALDRTSGALPAETLAVCERAVQVAQHELGDVRTRRAGTSTEVISVVLCLYREGGPAVHARCLDLIDALSDVQAYGLAEALADER